jgi:hypothetical protein
MLVRFKRYLILIELLFVVCCLICTAGNDPISLGSVTCVSREEGIDVVEQLNIIHLMLKQVGPSLF